MRIVVNDIAASKGGALTVLKDFYNCVRENDTENEWIFLLGDNILEETDNIRIITLPHIKNSRKKKLLFDLFTGKKFINSLQPDVVFSLQNTLTFGVKAPQVIYLHQSIPFQKIKKFSFLKSAERPLAVYQHLIGRIIKRSVKKCHKVIVQTKWMQEAVANQCRLPEEKIVRVAPTVADVSAYNTDVPFNPSHFFYPTAQPIYKNNAAIFKACELLNEKNIHCDVALTLPEQHSKGDVHCVGRLPYDEVIEKYAESTLVFPSYLETFGYPMAEARKVGTVILASDCPFSREVLDGYENAYFFDPFRPQELASLMERVITGDIQKKASVKADAPYDGWNAVAHILLRYM